MLLFYFPDIHYALPDIHYAISVIQFILPGIYIETLYIK